MSDSTVYWAGNETPCPDCGHWLGIHGFATAGCSRIGTAGWCPCSRIPDHPAHVAAELDSDGWYCGICNARLDVSFVHPLFDSEWRCSAAYAEHWPSDPDDPESVCGYCGADAVGSE